MTAATTPAEMSAAFRVATRREDRVVVAARMAAAQVEAEQLLTTAVATYAATIAALTRDHTARLRTRAHRTGRTTFTARHDQADFAAAVWAATRRVNAAAATANAIRTGRHT